MRKLYLESAQVATAVFDPNESYSYCRLCGAIYQAIDVPEPLNTAMRRNWSEDHSNNHSEKEHANYANSGLFLTPEAQIRLAAFGIVDLTANDEIRQALGESDTKLDNLDQPSRKELKEHGIL
jgi:hypothetical protein